MAASTLISFEVVPCQFVTWSCFIDRFFSFISQWYGHCIVSCQILIWTLLHVSSLHLSGCCLESFLMMKGILPCPLWLKQYFCKLFNTGLSLLILSPCNLYSLFILPCLFWIGDVECLCYFLISSNPFKLIAF